MRQKLVWRWEPERPAANSLRLLPSGPDRVGEDCVRPTPAAHMAAAAGKCKMRRSGPPPCPQSSFEINARSEEHTSELQSLMRISYAVFCLKKKNQKRKQYQDKVDDNQ